MLGAGTGAKAAVIHVIHPIAVIAARWHGSHPNANIYLFLFEYSENTNSAISASPPAEGIPLPSDSAFSLCHMSAHHLVQSYASSILSFCTANQLVSQILPTVPPLGLS